MGIERSSKGNKRRSAVPGRIFEQREEIFSFRPKVRPIVNLGKSSEGRGRFTGMTGEQIVREFQRLRRTPLENIPMRSPSDSAYERVKREKGPQLRKTLGGMSPEEKRAFVRVVLGVIAEQKVRADRGKNKLSDKRLG
jgi:hypothetical protein